ncbi:MAG: hypothetical protein ACYTGW_18545 [Planctomycetota bacterium]|jgi:hypothetical protein
MYKLPVLALAVLPVVLAPLSAQFPQVVGITRSTPVVMQQLMSTQLRCAQNSCNLTFEKQTLTGAGGSAYDSRLGGLWITNGLSLACVDVATCNFLCKPVKMPLPPLSVQRPWCTGLAYVDSGAKGSNAAAPGWLFASYNTGDIARIDIIGCQIRKTTFCKATGLPTGYKISGLATDDVRRYLYVGASAASTTGISNIITVAPIDPTPANAKPWCSPACRIVVPPCSSASPLGAIQGLAHDSCKGMLFVTDGKQTLWGLVGGLGTTRCTITVLGCCPLNVGTAGDTYTGLCLRPTPSTSSGKPCTLPSCNNCSAVMQATLVGDANLGNPAFGLGLRNAPSNSDAAAFALNIGACTSPGANFGYCATVRVPLAPPPLILLFFGLPPAPGACNRNLTVPAPVPLSAAICGQSFSFQWVVRCPPSPAGPGNFGITNCLTASVSGS